MKVVKESSDELNPSVVTTAFIGRAPRERGALDYVALGVATCGVGLIPLAPGTWGSLVGVGIYMAWHFVAELMFGYDAAYGWHQSPEPFRMLFTAVLLLVIAALCFAGTWAATQTETLLRRKDPGAVVIDEVVGQLITFLFVPFNAGAWVIVTGFVAFRVFDIWKPYPIRRLESLEAGLGIMADDVLAGIYAATLMSLLTSIYLLF